MNQPGRQCLFRIRISIEFPPGSSVPGVIVTVFVVPERVTEMLATVPSTGGLVIGTA
jgi:hypothetical protein